MTILPLVHKSIDVSWRYPVPGDYFSPATCTASLHLHERVHVADFEFRHRTAYPLQNEAERCARLQLLRRVYPKELIQELRAIRLELDMRSRHSYMDPDRDLSERLAVVTAQLAGE